METVTEHLVEFVVPGHVSCVMRRRRRVVSYIVFTICLYIVCTMCPMCVKRVNIARVLRDRMVCIVYIGASPASVSS